MSKGNIDVTKLGKIVLFVFGLLFFYYVDKYEHIVSRLTKWAKRNKLLHPNESNQKRRPNKGTFGKSKNTQNRKESKWSPKRPY